MKGYIGLLAVAALLTGCGGSSGGNAVEQSSIQRFNDSVQLDPRSGAQSFTGEADREALNNQQTTGLDYIVLNGKNIPLVPASGVAQDYNYVDNGNVKVLSSGSFLSYSRFAVLAVDGYATLGTTYIGVPTEPANIPAQGQAHYEGLGLHLVNNSDAKKTTVSADIDFGERQGTVNIKGDSVPAFSINGHIRGNSLLNDSPAANLNAKFYGNGAQNLTGQYFRNEDSGVFGTSKQ